MEMTARRYLVRYGLMNHVGPFAAGQVEVLWERGRRVVIRTDRGVEVGEILAPVTTVAADPGSEAIGTILRDAGADDLEAHRRAQGDRDHRFDLCRGLIDRGGWPIVAVDLENTLDPARSILYYLGPDDYDPTGLKAAAWAAHRLDLTTEPAVAPPARPKAASGCGTCGGCGSGGCGIGVTSVPLTLA
jgi:cell fate regulator YaaT (PSP1 superfamily)